MLNTCDKYNDLWPIFFDCISKFWDCGEVNIYINSESLDYFDARYNIINIHPPQINMDWSSRLKYCTSIIKEDYVINIPEECLIEETVDMSLLYKSIQMLDRNSNIASICFVHIPGEKFDSNEFMPFKQRKYDLRNLISQQACIWRREKWLKYITTGESPWEYEALSSARGIYKDDIFFAVDDNVSEVLRYNYGYIVYRGFWCKEELERLNTKLNIKFDLSKREIMPKAEIDKITKRNLVFYFTLRIKKYIILIKKKIGLKCYTK
jgi:hypothetical protein